MTGAVTFRTAVRRALVAAALTLLVAGGLVVALDGRSARSDTNVVFDEAGSSAPRISLIGDSTLTGVRWYGRYGALQQFNFVLNAESCRRTVEPSCVSREGFRSENVLATMYSLSGQLGEVLVVMSGYNDPRWSIPRSIDHVVEEARRQGVEHVIWLTLRASDDVDYSDPQHQSSINSFREYNERLLESAEATDGYLQVADWATYTLGASGWFESDGVHLTRRGVDAVTTFIAGMVQRVVSGEDVTPTAAPWTILVPGAEGDVVEDVQQALVDEGIEVPGGVDGEYGNDTMIAVANYQRRDDNLQVTGAVDIRTARSLGVYEDPDAVDSDALASEGADDSGPDETPASMATTEPAPATTGSSEPMVAQVAVDSTESPRDDDGMPRWPIYSGSAVVALTAAVVGRRRYVVAQRDGRHGDAQPAHRADDASRERPAASTAPISIYDHELEDSGPFHDPTDD